jgi:hypothetical protein
MIFFSIAQFCVAASKIAVVVGDDIITTTDIQERVVAYKKIHNLNPQSYNKSELEKYVMNTLVEEKLYLQEAKKYDITVDKQFIDDKISEAIKVNPHLKDSTLKHTLREQIKAQIYWAKLVNLKFRQNIVIGDDELNAALKMQKYNQDLVLKQIIIPNAYYNVHQKKISKSLNQISGCSDIGNFKEQYIAAEIQEINTDYNSLNEQIKQTIDNLAIGKVSNVIDLGEYKQFIIICKKSTSKNQLGQNKTQLQNYLTEKKLETAAKNYLSDIRKRTFIEYR